MMMKDVKHWKKLVHAGILSAAYTCEDGLKKSVGLTRVELDIKTSNTGGFGV